MSRGAREAEAGESTLNNKKIFKDIVFLYALCQDDDKTFACFATRLRKRSKPVLL